MKRTNRYPNGQPLLSPGTTTYKRRDTKRGPVVDTRWQHPLQIGATDNKPNVHAMANPHGIPMADRVKIEFAIKHAHRLAPKALTEYDDSDLRDGSGLPEYGDVQA